MRLQSKSISKVALVDILRRRRSNLEKYLQESGIVTYELLQERCNSMGVLTPSKEAFLKAKGTKDTDAPSVSSPTEGIVVIEVVTEPSDIQDRQDVLVDAPETTDNSHYEELAMTSPDSSSKKKKSRKSELS